MDSVFGPARTRVGLFLASALTLIVGACSTPQATGPASRPPAVPAATAPRVRVMDSVVKVYATVRQPELLQPWMKGPPTEVQATGVVIAGDRILTSARVTEYATDLQIQARGSADRIPATVECSAPTFGLAVLRVKNPAFFAQHPPLPIAENLPNLKDSMLVYGYPAASTEPSVATDIVSSIDFASYSYAVAGLRLKTDEAVDSGMLGGPAVVGGKIAGVTLLSVSGGGSGATYFVPAPELELFLRHIVNGRYTGKPGIREDFQTLENPALRAYLHLPAAATGLVVSRPYLDDRAYPLRKWDLITKIGDTPVDDQGRIVVGDGLRLRFSYLVQTLLRDGRVPLTIIRDGRARRIDLPVTAHPELVEPYLDGTYPSYFIYGPVVFSTATQEFLGAIRQNAAMVNLLAAVHNPLFTRQYDRPAFPGEQLVVVASPLFADKLSQGYGNPATGVVESVDGIPIRNLRQLVEVLRDTKGAYVVIKFHDRGRQMLAFPRAEMAAATNRILAANDVRSQGSPALMKVWNRKAGP